MASTKTYSAEVIVKRLNTSTARRAMFNLISRGDAEEINRVMNMFVQRGMIASASKMIDWHSRASVGLLSIEMIRF